MKLGFGLVVAAGLWGSVAAGGQVVAYADLSASKLTNPGVTHILFGPTIGLSAQVFTGKRFVVSGDLRGQFLGGGNRLDTVSVGAKVAFPVHGFQPYVEGAVGFGRYNSGAGVANSASTDSEIQAIGGIDHRLRGNFDLRVFEFSYEQYYGMMQTFDPLTFSTGIVYHLGGRGK